MTTPNVGLMTPINNIPIPTTSTPYKTWLCVLCGWVYDEIQGDPAGDIPAGTYWADVPEDWLCPDCGVGKSEFSMIEI